MGARILFRCPHLTRELGGKPLVIVVQERDPTASGFGHARVARPSASYALSQRFHAQSGIFNQSKRLLRLRIVAVHNDDDFDIAPCLAQNAFYRALHQLWPPIAGNHYGNQWR